MSGKLAEWLAALQIQSNIEKNENETDPNDGCRTFTCCLIHPDGPCKHNLSGQLLLLRF